MRLSFAALARYWNGWKRRLAARRFRPGTVVRGRYELVKPIGEGSYGLAYLCRDRRRDGRLCVLKHVQPMRGGAARTEATFQLETRMLSRLRHPAVPRLLEKFRYKGTLCFTMDYMPGKSLEKLLFEEDRVYTEFEALALCRRLLDVVGDVHAEGVVHRDIRIANVILDGDTVSLIDFGLARSLTADEEHAEDEPADDLEEDAPAEKRIRRRIRVESDFYALGHLLLFLLYSNFPDTGEEPERAWEEELAHLHTLTKKLLRRLLLTEQPYERAADAAADVNAAMRAFLLEETS
ncbi:protein kinase [Paenibacillus sp. TRM 82003]|nr:protein kinase [Paenibacillus sp. TRM 82003]